MKPNRRTFRVAPQTTRGGARRVSEHSSRTTDIKLPLKCKQNFAHPPAPWGHFESFWECGLALAHVALSTGDLPHAIQHCGIELLRDPGRGLSSVPREGMLLAGVRDRLGRRRVRQHIQHCLR